jgi:hypothetical protein
MHGHTMHGHTMHGHTMHGHTNIKVRFYVLERPDDDFMKVETCSLV